MTYKVKLEIFEGPLDLLLYLIKKEEIDIYDIPIAKITDQYLEYLEMLKLLDLDIAGEFIVMAATLMQIKSRMLLPPEEVPEGVEIEQEDPRVELVKRLLEYKKFKEAADELAKKEATAGQLYSRQSEEKPIFESDDSPFFEASIFDLLTAFSKILKEIPKEAFYKLVKDEFTVGEKIHDIFHILVNAPKIYFSKLFSQAKSKLEIIVTFLAVLELMRLKEILVVQKQPFGEIEIIRNPDMVKPK